jgi:MFS family permease
VAETTRAGPTGPAAIGPFVGGGLVDEPGWRWPFLLNVPSGSRARGSAQACS